MAALDYFADPQNVGILGLAQGILQSAGPQPFPHSFGQALGAGFGGMQSAQHAALINQLANQQQLGLAFANRRAQIQADLLQRAISGQPMLGSPSGYEGALSAQPPAQSPPGVSPSTLQNAFPRMPAQEAGALSAANTTTPAPGPGSGPPAYFNPEQMFQEGRLMNFAGLPGGDALMSGALGHDIRLRPPTALKPGGSLVSATGQNIYTAPNIPVGMQMTGGTAQNIPGYIPALSGQEQTRAGANAMFAVHPVQTASGASIPTFGANLPGFPGAAGVQPPPSMTPAPAPQPRPFAPPAQAKPDPADPWASMPRLEIPQGLGQSTYQKGRMEDAAKLGGELTTKASDAAGIANERLVYNTQALDLVNSATTGKGALSVANVKNFLHSRLNVPLEMMDKVVAGDANATTALNKDLINAATQKAKQAYGSRITQSEVMLQIKQASPNVDQLTGTIRYLLQTDSAMSTYQIQKAQNLGTYLKQGGDPYQFEGWHSQAFPMSAAVSNIHLPGPQANAMETQAKSAWGAFEPTKYEYRLNEAGQLQRRAK